MLKFYHVEVLNPTNPIMSDSKQKAGFRGRFKARLSNPRVSILICSFAVALVLITNVSLTIAAVKSFGTTNGISTLYEGSCSRMKIISLWSHLGINALAAVLVISSNYCKLSSHIPAYEPRSGLTPFAQVCNG